MTRAPAAADADLVNAASAGDHVAFANIVAAYHEDMRRVCAVVTGDDRIAEEAVGAAWPICWRKLSTLRDPSRLRPWLVSIAVNEARQLLRANRRRTIVERGISRDDQLSRASDPALGIGAIDLRNALDRLDPHDRALIAMRYLLGFDATELAIATGRSASGTRARLGRLLHRLERELGDE